MSHRVIYVGGLGRSGTTLLERLLGELPGRRRRSARSSTSGHAGSAGTSRAAAACRSAAARSGGGSASARSAAGAPSSPGGSSRSAAGSTAPGASPFLARRTADGRAVPPGWRAAARTGLREYAAAYRRLYRRGRRGHRRRGDRRFQQARLPRLLPRGRGRRRAAWCTWSATPGPSRTRGAGGCRAPRTARPMTRWRPAGDRGALARPEPRLPPARPPRRAGDPGALRGPASTRRASTLAQLALPPRPARRRSRLPRPTARPSSRSGTPSPATPCGSRSARCRCAATTPGAPAWRGGTAGW